MGFCVEYQCDHNQKRKRCNDNYIGRWDQDLGGGYGGNHLVHVDQAFCFEGHKMDLPPQQIPSKKNTNEVDEYAKVQIKSQGEIHKDDEEDCLMHADDEVILPGATNNDRAMVPALKAPQGP